MSGAGEAKAEVYRGLWITTLAINERDKSLVIINGLYDRRVLCYKMEAETSQ